MTEAGSGTLSAAAMGCIEAQRTLSELALAQGKAGSVRLVEALSSAELWARMAVSHERCVLADVRRLAGVLMMRGEYERTYGMPELGASCDAEALTLLAIAADDGDEEAARLLLAAAEEMPSGGVVLAQQMRSGEPA